VGHAEKGCKAKKNALRLNGAAVFNTEQGGGKKRKVTAAAMSPRASCGL
jgi:hypothetical protein